MCILFTKHFNTCHQRRYILKFASDGAVLTHTKNAVQATMKLIPADSTGKVDTSVKLPSYFNNEIILYYYIGINKYIYFKLYPLD